MVSSDSEKGAINKKPCAGAGRAFREECRSEMPKNEITLDCFISAIFVFVRDFNQSTIKGYFCAFLISSILLTSLSTDLTWRLLSDCLSSSSTAVLLLSLEAASSGASLMKALSLENLGLMTFFCWSCLSCFLITLYGRIYEKARWKYTQKS